MWINGNHVDKRAYNNVNLENTFSYSFLEQFIRSFKEDDLFVFTIGYLV
jgi:hypothetical protein